MVEKIIIDDSLFPVDDGITADVVDGINPTYDLRELLSNTMRSRPQWEDFAKASSKILYDVIEKQRIALSLDRTPENISRSLKILALRMLGLDYRSDLLRDADYDRALNTISAYNIHTSGKESFVKYMGFIKDSKFELMPLWSQDYKDFEIGPAIGWKTVYDTPTGPWFPTTHVGLLYEEFSNNTVIDEEDLKRLFYTMAPINLVLEWIAGQLTLRLNTLYMAINFYESSEDTTRIVYDSNISLYMHLAMYERTEDTILTYDGLYSKVAASDFIRALDVTKENAIICGQHIDWAANVNQVQDFAVRQSNLKVLSYDAANNLVLIQHPNQKEYDAQNNLLGECVMPERINYVSSGTNLRSSIFTYNANVKVSASKVANMPCSGASCVYLTVANSAVITFSSNVEGINAITFIYKSSAAQTKLARGSSNIIINNADSTIASSANVSGVKINMLADGFIKVCATMSGKDVNIWLAFGETAIADCYWHHFQVENGNYASREIYTSIRSISRPYTHWQIKTNELKNYRKGVMLMKFSMPMPEWESETLTLFEFLGPYSKFSAEINTSGRLSVNITNLNYNYSTDSEPPLANLTIDEPNSLVVVWDVLSRRLSVYFNNTSAIVEDIDWPTDIIEGSFFRKFTEQVRATYYCSRLMLMGLPDAVSLLSENVLEDMAVAAY